MAVEFSPYRTFKNFAVAPEDIQPGEVDGLEVLVNQIGAISKVQIARRSVTITIRGIRAAEAKKFVQEAERNRVRMILGNLNGEKLDFESFTLEDAILVKATPSQPIGFIGEKIVEQIQLEYQSQLFT